MKSNPVRPLFATALMLLTFLPSCNKTPTKPKETPLVIREDSATAQTRAKDARANVVARVAEGLELSLWASDSLAPDPVAMDIDDSGRVYLTRTNRQKHSEFDIRGYRHWMTPSIALQSVEDRRAFLHETFAPEKSEENAWLEDLNGDGSHDWKDLAVEKDEIWMLQDEDGDGIAESSTRILADFDNEVADVAGALLVRDDEVFVGIGPDMWRTWDSNDDGVLDEKVSIAHGFAVHIGFGGHGMSGAIQGPDGKIYYGIGDIGASITTVDGEKHHYPNQGVIVRSNPDGSNFEVFARGLRNTHEFVFDAYGNIISADNDGDHRGESERLVHIVEGSDAGWRANWQYGKYTDPKNNDYKVWMDEKLYVPHWEGQAAYIIPPIKNFHNGPTGMVYNPGTALGEKWLDQFFLVEFVGDPTLSHIWSFKLKPKGASFDLAEETDVLSGVLPTGIRFGPDGALYLADWISGWDTKNFGRVWKLDVTANQRNLADIREETEQLMTLDFEEESMDRLVELLSHPDMRIRQKAQFALAKNTSGGYGALEDVIQSDTDQFARIHAIWGIGQIAAEQVSKAAPLMGLLNDKDPEIIAQAAKVLGDVRYQDVGETLVGLLTHDHARVRFYAAQGLGRIAYKEAVQPLLKLLSENKDEDLYLRHAAVLALSRIGDTEPIIALADSDDRSLRIAAVLVLRRLEHPEVAQFLDDEDEYIVTEAARAINDDWSIEDALPNLAALLPEQRFTSEPLLRRAINAALRVGGEEAVNNLIAFSKRSDVSNTLRGEALATLASWGEPSVLDRVDGRYRGEIKRDPAEVREKLEEDIPMFLKDREPEILLGVIKVLSSLDIASHNNTLFDLLRSNPSENVRSAALEALSELDPDGVQRAMELGMRDSNEDVRSTAIGMIDQITISKEELPRLVDPIFRNGSLREQQRMLQVLGDLPLDQSGPVLEKLIAGGRNGLARGATLDLIEAVEATGSEPLKEKLQAIRGGDAEDYQETLYGGNSRQGRRIFNNNPTAQCVRCHALGGAGGQVGPPMDNIGNILTREQLLEALIEPGARLAPGYGSVAVTLTDGQEVTGILYFENDRELHIKTSDAEPMEIVKSRITKRQNLPSGMPAMGLMISKREVRDLIEFLSGLKEENPGEGEEGHAL